MIRYALKCDAGHPFESWFQSSASFDGQAARGLVACPMCGSEKVEKAIMAPRLGRSDKRRATADRRLAANRPVEADQAPARAEERAQVAMMSPAEHELRGKLKQLRDHVIRNADYVGPKFSEEARRMHYGEAQHRSIYGEASAEDAAALTDEGIEFHHLPRLPDDWN